RARLARAARHGQGPHPPRTAETARLARAPLMIDERQEELASLYALDLLEGAERAEFEQALAGDTELQALVRQLREASTALAHSTPAARVPVELKSRVLASIGRPAPDNVI